MGECMRQSTKRLERAFELARLAGAACLAIGAASADPKALWPQYRGPNRNGISSETGLLKTWPESGPKVLWKVPLGDGYSGISVVGDRLYTMLSQESDDFVAAYGAADGKEIWRTKIEPRWTDDMGDGPRSTPTVDGDVVYAVGSRGLLMALSAKTGEKIWSKDLKEEFGAQVPRWGVSTSPLVEKDLVVVDA